MHWRARWTTCRDASAWPEAAEAATLIGTAARQDSEVIATKRPHFFSIRPGSAAGQPFISPYLSSFTKRSPSSGFDSRNLP